MIRVGKIELEDNDPDGEVAYVRLPDHPGTVPGAVKKSISLQDLLGAYIGPELIFDFDDQDKLIGIEILV